MKTTPLIAFLLFPVMAARAEFLQEDRARDPAHAVLDGLRIDGLALDAAGRAVAATSKGLYREEAGAWKEISSGSFAGVKLGGDKKLYAASGDRLLEVDEGGRTAVAARHPLGAIGDFAVNARGEALVAGPVFEQDTVTWSRSGRFQPKANVWFHPVSTVPGGPVPRELPIFAWSVASSADGTFWIAAKQGLHSLGPTGLRRVRPPAEELWVLGEKMEGLLAARDGGVLYSHDNGITRYDPRTGAWTGMRPDTHGVPFPYARALAEEPGGALWIGGSIGAARRDASGRFVYYQGQAWLPHDGVTAVACGPEGRIYLGTESGLSVITRAPMTLERKAAHFEELAEKRHTNRHGVTWQVSCRTPGDVTTAGESGYSDNDGTWTADYLLGECLRFAVTREEGARRNARRAMELIAALETVTGIPGYPARAYTLASLEGENPAFAEWHRSPDGKHLWKGDTSSDEIVGHYLAHAAYWDNVAEDGEERERLRKLVRALTDHILDHGLTLVERPDGEPTRWGIYSPERCWEWGHYWYSSGLWSLCILSHLKVASHITREPRYEEVYRMLIEKHDYARRTLNQKVVIGEVNHSDDHMAIMSYYPLLLYEKDPDLRATYLESFRRSWEVERPERSPLWNLVRNWAFGDRVDLRESVEHLQDMPWMLYKWSHDNSRRWDLPLAPFLKGRAESARALGMKERGPYYFTDNPYSLRSGDGGQTVESPVIYLVPYWLGRRHGLIAAGE